MWADYFIGAIVGAKAMVSIEGRPYVSIQVEKDEFVEIHLTVDESKLPFEISFTGKSEDRVYGYAGTKDLARKLAIEVVELRLNSHELATSAY